MHNIELDITFEVKKNDRCTRAFFIPEGESPCMTLSKNGAF